MRVLALILTFILVLPSFIFAGEGAPPSDGIVLQLFDYENNPAYPALVELHLATTGDVPNTLLAQSLTDQTGYAQFLNVTYNGTILKIVVTYQGEEYIDYIDVGNDPDEIIVVRLPEDGGNGGIH